MTSIFSAQSSRSITMTFSSIVRSALAGAFVLASVVQASAQTLLNVSYDPTRELYSQINAAFIKDYAAKNGGKVLKIEQSHGGSGRTVACRHRRARSRRRHARARLRHRRAAEGRV